MKNTLTLAAGTLVCLTNLTAGIPPVEQDKPYRYLYVSGTKLAQAPTLDGVVNAAEWAGAGMSPRLYQHEEDRLMDLESKFYFGYTAEAFYLAFQIQRPAGASEPRAQVVDRDRSLFRLDDALEFWLNALPGPRPDPGLRDFYLMWNARGTHYDRRDQDHNLSFNPDWQSVCRTVPGYGWEGEVRLPFAEFTGMPVPVAGEEWRYNLLNNPATPAPALGMSGWDGEWGLHANFTRLRFTADTGVFVRVLESGLVRGTSRGGGVFEVVNPGPQSQTVNGKLRLYRKKADAPGKFSYLRSFEQSRDKGGSSDAGKVLLMIADDKLSEMIIAENYERVKEENVELALGPGERRTTDFLLADKVGDYLLLYEFRGADGKLIAGGPLPFLIPAPLAVQFAKFFLQDKTVTASIDLRHIPGWQADSQLEARVGKLTERWSAAKLGPKHDYKFSIRDWPVGEHSLQLTARDAAGAVLAERTVPLNIPATPSWFTEKAGLSPAVPEPWTPIRAVSNRVAFLMGEYELGAAGFAAQVNVRSIYDEKQVPLLRSPITLEGKVNGADLVWKAGQFTLNAKHDATVSLTGRATAGDLTLSTDVTFEYDGLEKIVVTLTPPAGGTVAINELALLIPFQKEFSTLFLSGLTIQPAPEFNTAGAVPATGQKFPFVTSMWVGNEERGFRWFSENMKGWHVGGAFAAEAVELLSSAAGTTLKLNLIKDNQPFVLDKPRTITLGFMFTPPKPVRADLVKIAATSLRAEEGQAGVNAFETWYFKNQGWPEVHDEAERAEKLAVAQQAHQFGMKVTPYSGWYLHRQSRIHSVFGGEMVVEPLVDAGAGCDTCCWNTPVQDAYTSLLADRIRDIDLDGFRLDAGFAVENCSSLVHRGYGSDCGWRDDQGRVQPSRGLFAARAAAQRAYRLFHGGMKEGGLCIQHVHGGNRYDPILSHMDAVLSVEGKEMLMKSLAEAPLDFYRANVMGDAHGYQVVYLPKSRAMGYDSFYGLALLHNFNPRGLSPVAFHEVSYSRAAASPREVWRAREWIGPYNSGTEFWGYWKNRAYLKTSSPQLISGFHVRRGEKLLLAALNLDRQPRAGTITLDLAALGFTGPVYAYDPILAEPVPLAGTTLNLTFTPEGYRCIQIGSQPFAVFEPEKLSANLLTNQFPTGWQASKYLDDNKPLALTGTDLAVSESGIELTGDGAMTLRFRKELPGLAGKFYMLEGEATITCRDGQFLGEYPDASQLAVVLGDLYWGNKRTFTGQPLPGTTQKFRLYTAAPGVIDIALRQARGTALIKRLELYEVKSLPPGFQVGRYKP